MEYSTIETARTPEGDTIFTFQDSLSYEHINLLWENITDFLKNQRPQGLILDFRHTETLDSAGVALLRFLRRYCERRQIRFEYRSVPPGVEQFMRYVETEPPPKEASPPSAHPVSRLGSALLDKISDIHDLIQFLGECVVATLGSLRRFRHFRWKEMLYYAQLSGAHAMPIVFLLNFLVGLVMAFQAAVQLRQFGANIFVADLVSLSITRELGPVFTAVILAGRSGSAFAAEIGTMKVNEEIDALKVMGFDITEFLVIPKVLALAFTGPLLTMLANAAGILGGIVVGVLNLDLTVSAFMQQMYMALSVLDIASGLLKSFVFAVLVALIGCFRGLQTGKDADSVGRQTTSAVVSGIFLIIFADAVFTFLFHIFGW